MTVGYTQQDGLRIGAENVPLPFASLPAVQNASMSIAATRRPDGSGWTFAGAGTATLAVTGASGTIDLGYQDGRVTMTAVGQVARGPASGTLTFTATNSPLDEAGRPVDGPPSTTIRVWGRGAVTIQFGPILRGTAGVELTPDNRVIISGQIALPPQLPVFQRIPFHRDLLSFEPPEFPILGVSVAGVGVGVFAYVRVNISFDAYVGAGVIRGAAVTAVLDLDHPELATVHGHGEFFVPAYGPHAGHPRWPTRSGRRRVRRGRGGARGHPRHPGRRVRLTGRGLEPNVRARHGNPGGGERSAQVPSRCCGPSEGGCGSLLHRRLPHVRSVDQEPR